MEHTTLIYYLLVPLIGWRLYRRIRRMVGRQTSVAWRHWVTVLFFPTLLILLGVFAAHSPLAIEAEVGGIAIGLGLAIVGLRLTRFEQLPEGFFYTPNAHIGIAISLIFAGRILYRIIHFASLGLAPSSGFDGDFGRSPWTLLIFGVLAAYYTTYAIGLLRWRSRATETT